MALVFREKITTHESIYLSDVRERTLTVEYVLPSAGTNLETGILFLIPAYGGNLASSVYRKMRMQFPDKYNLIVIQCDFFGIGHMQGMNEKLEEFLEIGKKTDTPNKIKIQTEETFLDCNDMGIMQAADILRAGLYVIHKLSARGVKMNFGKIITYGSSHGSYLGYVVNRLCPGFIKLVIDNSAYLLPNYIWEDRPLYYQLPTRLQEKYELSKLRAEINYLINRQREDFLPNSFYDLYSLYEGFENDCMILSFHGTNDAMVSITEKRRLIEGIKNASLIEISKEDVDGTYFKSSEHGLGVDLLNLYEAVEDLSQNAFIYSDSLEISETIVLEKEGHCLYLNYGELKPHITWIKPD